MVAHYLYWARTHKGYSRQKLKFSLDYLLCLAREESLDPLFDFISARFMAMKHSQNSYGKKPTPKPKSTKYLMSCYERKNAYKT